MTHSIKTVGFIGTGLMGLPMAKNILAKKFKLNVWNRTFAPFFFNSKVFPEVRFQTFNLNFFAENIFGHRQTH